MINLGTFGLRISAKVFTNQDGFGSRFAPLLPLLGWDTELDVNWVEPRQLVELLVDSDIYFSSASF